MGVGEWAAAKTKGLARDHDFLHAGSQQAPGTPQKVRGTGLARADQRISELRSCAQRTKRTSRGSVRVTSGLHQLQHWMFPGMAH